MGKYLSLRQLEKHTESDWRTGEADENANYCRNAGKVLEIAATEYILTGLGVPSVGAHRGASLGAPAEKGWLKCPVWVEGPAGL